MAVAVPGVSDGPTYDHVIELRNVSSSATPADVTELVQKALGSFAIMLLDVTHVDDNTVMVTCQTSVLFN